MPALFLPGRARRPAIRLAGVAAFLLSAIPAQAQPVPFAFLIKDGWSRLFQNQAIYAPESLTSFSARSEFYSIVNNQKAGQAGNALIYAWGRPLPQPFTPLGSLAGAVTLDFGSFRAHLSVLESPAGVQTAIGIVNENGTITLGATGAWAFANGAGVAGGTANDLVVGGIVNLTPVGPVGELAINMSPYFPTFPNPGVPSQAMPFSATIMSQALSLGSFVGTAQGPLVTYSRIDTQFNGFADRVSMMVITTGGGNSGIVVCSDLGDHTADNSFLNTCTISGVGAYNQLVGRSGFLVTPFTMIWQLFQLP
jgi:hypothetical protein